VKKVIDWTTLDSDDSDDVYLHERKNKKMKGDDKKALCGRRGQAKDTLKYSDDSDDMVHLDERKNKVVKGDSKKALCDRRGQVKKGFGTTLDSDDSDDDYLDERNNKMIKGDKKVCDRRRQVNKYTMCKEKAIDCDSDDSITLDSDDSDDTKNKTKGNLIDKDPLKTIKHEGTVYICLLCTYVYIYLDMYHHHYHYYYYHHHHHRRYHNHHHHYHPKIHEEKMKIL
jgi:hypothetical protein